MMYRVVLLVSMATLLLTCVILSACTPHELVISPDFAQETKEALGYALAPTYLPKEMYFSRGDVIDISTSEWPDIAPFVQLTYTSDRGEHIVVQYPADWPIHISSPPGLEIPEDAVSEININGKTAYLVRGSWPQEVYNVLTETGKVPTNAEWDYVTMTGLLFTLDLPDGETIGAMMTVGPYPAAWISSRGLVKIAESITIVY